MNICRKLTFNGIALGKKSTLTFNKEFSRRSCERFYSNKTFDMEKEKKDFFEAYPRLVEDLAKHPKLQELPIANEWMKKVIDGVVPGGKASRGLTAVLSYKIVEDPENVTEETVLLAQALGWCAEFFQAYCVILDDIIDGSLTRRGRPCWHLKEEVGLAHAINDASLIYACLNNILQDKFENSPIYVKLYQIFNETLFYSSIGQFLDVKGSQVKKNYDAFTTENYDAIVKHKSSYYTYKLPISTGLLLANHFGEESAKNCEEMSFLLGRLFQMQDDYIDCFGDESLTGKKGTDIQEGKCTWLAVNALPRCNARTRAVFNACYGSNEPAHIERIKQLYVQLQIPQLYKQQEREIHDIIIERISTMSSVTEQQLFRQLLYMTYDRKK